MATKSTVQLKVNIPRELNDLLPPVSPPNPGRRTPRSTFVIEAIAAKLGVPVPEDSHELLRKARKGVKRKDWTK